MGKYDALSDEFEPGFDAEADGFARRLLPPGTARAKVSIAKEGTSKPDKKGKSHQWYLIAAELGDEFRNKRLTMLISTRFFDGTSKVGTLLTNFGYGSEVKKTKGSERALATLFDRVFSNAQDGEVSWDWGAFDADNNQIAYGQRDFPKTSTGTYLTVFDPNGRNIPGKLYITRLTKAGAAQAAA